jgi:tRNA threonylcarbamoyl adenosine modification protein YjeE
MAGPTSTRCAAEVNTVALGRRIGRCLLPGDLLSLHGELGAGKTVLVRGIAIGAGADPAVVRSPTFVLHQVYRGSRLTVHHLDLYRLGSGADVSLLDVDGLLEGGAVVAEWGELADLGRFEPVDVTLDVADGGARRVTLGPRSPARIARAWEDDDPAGASWPSTPRRATGCSVWR